MTDDLGRELRDRLRRSHLPAAPVALRQEIESLRSRPTPVSARRRPLRPAALLFAAVLTTGAVLAASIGLGSTTRTPAPSARADVVAQSATTTQRPSASAGLFGNLGGWIAFGDNRGIWAIDPTQPAARDGRVQLSSQEGTPRAWSPDGSKLLVQRHMAAMETVLFVLNSDGSETRLTKAWFDSGGDFTADGSQVIYASQREGQDGFGIYLIDADGGTPELLLASGPRGLYDTWLYEPTFSPDGKEIAYFDGMGDWGHSLRVMNSDGSGIHVVLENSITTGASHVMGLEWSPDGEHLVFALDSGGVYVVGVDGSGLVKLNATFENQVISIAGVDPHWSPDGSQISYNRATASGTFDSLIITRSDGTEAQQFDDGRSGPWNPREGRR